MNETNNDIKLDLIEVFREALLEARKNLSFISVVHTRGMGKSQVEEVLAMERDVATSVVMAFAINMCKRFDISVDALTNGVEEMVKTFGNAKE